MQVQEQKPDAEQEQVQIKTCREDDFALSMVFRWRYVIKIFLKKRKNYFNCRTKQNGPILSGRHSSTKIGTRETESNTKSCALPYYVFSAKFSLKKKFDYI